MRSVTTDLAAVDAAVTFILRVLPGFALMLLMAVLSSALRSTGSAQAGPFAYLLTAVLNMALAPVLIGGAGTGISLGVKAPGWRRALRS